MADEDAHEPYLLIFSDIKNKLGCIGPSKISWRVACALHGIGTERLGANAGSRFSWIRTKQQPSFLFLKKHSEHLSKKFRSTRKLPSLHFRKGWQDKKGLTPAHLEEGPTTDEESQRAKLHLPRIPSLFTWICLLFSRSTC